MKRLDFWDFTFLNSYFTISDARVGLKLCVKFKYLLQNETGVVKCN